VLKVATFNIRNGFAFDWCNSWWFRRRATLAAIVQLDADVVGLQEAYGFQLRWLAVRLPEMQAVGDGRSRRRRGERTSLLLRSASVEALSSTTRWFGGRADSPGTRLPGARFPRIATTARLRIAGGAEVAVTSTHLDERSKERRLHSASQLVSWLADDSCHQVVLGDLNATPKSDVLACFIDAGFARVDTGPDGTVHGFTGRTDGRIIDHVLVRGVAVVAAGVSHERRRGRLPSDHWPVWAELELGR